MTKKSYRKTEYHQPQNRIQPQYAAGNKQQQAFQGSVRKQQNPRSVDRHANLMNTGFAVPRNRMNTGQVSTQQPNRMYTGTGIVQQAGRENADLKQTGRADASVINAQQATRADADAASVPARQAGGSSADSTDSMQNGQGADAGQAQREAPGVMQGQTEAPGASDTGTAQESPDGAQEPQAAPEEIIQQQHEFEQWRTQETERLEHKEQKLHKQKKQIEQERMQLDIERRSFLHQQEFEVTRQRNEEQLLDMKRRILEDELYKLAEEKKQFEQKKSFYDKVDSYQAENALKKPASIQGAIFFAGVNGLGALKKRYKDLLKIYHPDNKCGDTDTIQEINKEYQRLLEKMKGREANGK